jgi:quercetin dioxygenase-like cupin family protein/uncharacterized membrane protein YphA (DoxX/SURF4 family)
MSTAALCPTTSEDAQACAVTATTTTTPRDLSSALLRLALAAAFASAVADRFGAWGPAGTPGVAWGDFASFTAYAKTLNPWAPAALVPFLAWAATAAEAVLAVTLAAGVATRLSALASGAMLFCFALAMTFTLGVKAPLNYSVFTAAAAALLLAMLPPDRWTLDRVLSWRRRPTPVALLTPTLLLVPVLHGCAAAPDKKGPVTASVLMTQALPQEVGSEARMLRVDLPPLAESPPHRHPGAIFAYVLEGEVVSGLDDESPQTYRRGDCWYERPGQVHRVSRNPSPTRTARLLVLFLTEPGKPVRVEEGR